MNSEVTKTWEQGVLRTSSSQRLSLATKVRKKDISCVSVRTEAS